MKKGYSKKVFLVVLFFVSAFFLKTETVFADTPYTAEYWTDVGDRVNFDFSPPADFTNTTSTIEFN